MRFTYLSVGNADYILELLQHYKSDPSSVDQSWQYFFDGFELGETGNGAISEQPTKIDAELRVAELILRWRHRGHLAASLDPLSTDTRAPIPDELDPKTVGLGEGTLKQILERLKTTYASTIGIECGHVFDADIRRWVTDKMEGAERFQPLDTQLKKWILERLIEAETFEHFLHTRYIAQKRFSLEGAESLMPGIGALLETASMFGVTTAVIGMAHRGRLNMLAHLMGKKAEFIFTEFDDNHSTEGPTDGPEGDVKYHGGFSNSYTCRNGARMDLTLAHNPSHLEFVNPVVEGMVHAKQFLLNDSERSSVLPILIHGDAAFAGQGIVYETLNFSAVPGYNTGGTIHIVINNQIGFTTDPRDSRSTRYCTDGAKMLEAPIFHVNGDDPEAVCRALQWCAEYRQRFHKDIFVDLVCYRKYGHNEGDEPTFTQPLTYQKIKTHPSTREQYAARLNSEGVFSHEQTEALSQTYQATLSAALEKTRQEKPEPYFSAFEGRWKNFRAGNRADFDNVLDSSVELARLRELGLRSLALPEGFEMHPKLKRVWEMRREALEKGMGLDWAMGEFLAYASLLDEGHPVRLTGQDAERGTFTHRHAVLHDVKDGKTFCPLQHLSREQAPFFIHNSVLSEAGALGFEFGWSTATPEALVIWEAQFGDFVNGAQVIIDQFLASAESKWHRSSGLVLYLPHGYEGQGPEHSSARLERFLQLCGRNNWVVANLTTPAQLFHALRRQLKWPFRKPLVLMTPKSLLRHPRAVSTLQDFADKPFREVLDDATVADYNLYESVKRVLLCTGKIYYDLLAEKEKTGTAEIALIRVEQLYPWPERQLADLINHYTNATQIKWVQEEPRNMGAWTYVFSQWAGALGNFSEKIGGRTIDFIGRPVSAAPAAGSHKLHVFTQKQIVESALGG